MGREVAITHMDADRARTLISQLRTAVDDVRAAIVELYQGRAWLPLGYPDWDAMCDAEIGVRLHLPIQARRALVTDLSANGLSSRAIGSALGMDQRTTRRDRGAANAAPATVVGLDGKRYTSPPASKGNRRAVSSKKPARDGVTTWSRRVQNVSAKCPMDDLTTEQVRELHGAATFLLDYCNGELRRRKAP